MRIKRFNAEVAECSQRKVYAPTARKNLLRVLCATSAYPALKSSLHFAAASALLLTGCSSLGSPPTVDIRTQCIPLTSWTVAQQDEMRREYDALAKDAILRAVFKDWVAMRDADRACQESASHGGH
jgi:hypothetical protein